MEIPDIKQTLTLAQIINHYNLKADKQNRINCPFHEDKTPSMQLYYKTHTAYCFSSNCKTHGKSLDVIDFVMHKDNCTKHEAIEKCKTMISGQTPQKNNATQSKEIFLQKMFTYWMTICYKIYFFFTISYHPFQKFNKHISIKSSINNHKL